MSFRFIEDHRDAYPVRLMCAVLEVSPAGYCAWRDRPMYERAKSNSALLAAIRHVHQDSSGRYGSPRVHAVLRRQGRGTSRGRIERMMRRYGIRAITAPPRLVRTTDSHPRSADRTEPDRARLHGFSSEPGSASPISPTSRPLRAGCIWRPSWISSSKDRRLGHAGPYASRTRIHGMAIQQQQPQAGLIHHSDRGAQSASHAYRDAFHERQHRRIDEPQGRLLRTDKEVTQSLSVCRLLHSTPSMNVAIASLTLGPLGG
jgi:hypothetical protein